MTYHGEIDRVSPAELDVVRPMYGKVCKLSVPSSWVCSGSVSSQKEEPVA